MTTTPPSAEPLYVPITDKLLKRRAEIAAETKRAAAESFKIVIKEWRKQKGLKP